MKKKILGWLLFTSAVAFASGATDWGNRAIKGTLDVTGITTLGTANITQANPGNIRATANTISTTNTNGDLTFDMNGTGSLILTDLSASGALSLDASKKITSGVLGIAQGGTNNGSLGVTAGGVLYSDGSKLMNVGAGSAGQVLKSLGASPPQWGAAQGGLISDRELISNTDIEVDASGYTAYADAGSTVPVDCTGGSPNSTITRSTSTPITNTGELLWTKAGTANRQGEGFSIPFTVGTADQAKVLQIDLDTIVRSGTFVAGSQSADSDLEIFVYDVTNSQLIVPTTSKIYSNSTSIPYHTVSNFQTSATGTSYRLCVHQATTVTANATVGFDNLSIHPSRYVYGSPITDWGTYSYTTTASLSTNVSSHTYKQRRVGDSLEIHGSIIFSGANTQAGVATLTLSSVTIDSSKVGSGARTLVGNWTYRVAASGAVFNGGVQYSSTTAVELTTIQGSTNTPTTIANNDSISYRLLVPISGWGSSVQMSESGDQRQVLAVMTKSGTASPATGDVQLSTFTATKDTHAGCAASSYTIPIAGDYLFSGLLEATPSSTQIWGLSYKINGGTITRVVNIVTGAGLSIAPFSVVIPNLRSGDVLTFFTYLGSGTITIGVNTTITISKMQSPATIGATETIAAKYYGSATAPGTTGSPNTISFTTKAFDTHNFCASGQCTLPAAGKYHIDACTYQTATTTAANNALCTDIAYNGSITNQGANCTYFTSATSKPMSVCVSDIVSGVAGDTITVKAGNAGTTPAMGSSDQGNFISVYRIGL